MFCSLSKNRKSRFWFFFSLFIMLFSSIHHTFICFKNIEPHHFDEKKEKKNKKTSYNTNNFIFHFFRLFIAKWSSTNFTKIEPETITNVINIRNFFKRTADSADLKKMKKICINWGKLSVQINEQFSDSVSAFNDFWKILSWLMTLISTMTWTILSNIVEFYHWFNWFFRLFFEILLSKDFSNEKIKIRIDSAKLMTFKICFRVFDRHSRFFLHISDNPFVINDKEKIDEISDFIRIASMKFKIDIIHLQNFYSKEQSMTQNCLNFITVSSVFFFDDSIFFNVLSFRNSAKQITRENNREAAAIVNFLNIVIISFLSKQSQNQNISMSNEKKIKNCKNSWQKMNEK